MRVLRLDLRAGSVDLHPFVTVARGLAPAAREELIDVLAGIPSGQAPVGGLVEAHGVLLDLTPAALDLLDLSSPLSVVVTAGDLPGTPAPESARLADARALARAAEHALAEAEAEVERSVQELEGARHALTAARGERQGDGSDGLSPARDAVALAAARRAEAEGSADLAAAQLAAADQAVLDAEQAATIAREQRGEATRAMSVAGAALDAATDRRDPVAVAAVETARRRVAAAELAVVAAREGQRVEPVDDAPEDDADLEVLRAERLEVAAAAMALETPDPLPVRFALDQVGAGGPIELENPPEAEALADRWVAVNGELDALGQAPPGGDPAQDRAEAVARVRAAEEALAALETSGRPGLDAAAIAELEEAHAEVNAARDAAERRLGAKAAKRRLEDALAAERVVLDRLGYVAYAEFLMGAPAASGQAGRDLAQAARARENLADAEDALRQLDDEMAKELRRAELVQQRRALRSAAVDLIGADPGSDVEGALRRHRVPTPGGAGGAGRLAQALEAVGLVIGDEELPERFVVDLAKVWLEEQSQVSTQRRALEQRVAALDTRIAERQRVDAIAPGEERPPLTEAVAALEEARAALRSAESRAARHAQAEAEVVERREAFEVAAKEEAAAVLVVGEAEAAVIRADEVRRKAAAALEAAQAGVAEAAGAEQAATDVLAALETQVEGALAHGIGDLEADVARRSADAATARAEAADRARVASEARATLAMAEAEEGGSGQVASEAQVIAAVEDIEWYLLARLAAQRAASFAGSVPLVLDDALAGLDPMSMRDVLDRLERMATTVQVVVVTEDLGAAAWATQLGPERAAVVEVGVTI